MNRLLAILLVPAVATALLAAGCATVPEPLQGEFVSTQPGEGAKGGARVRWGGEIISVEPKADLTCFQVLSRALSDAGRPRPGDESAGRFLACRRGFYDPAVFEPGREITVTGEVAGTETRRIGEYDYPLPRVDADVVYLWRERPEYVEVRDAWGPTPFFYSGWYGGYYRPYWPYRHHAAPRNPR